MRDFVTSRQAAARESLDQATAARDAERAREAALIQTSQALVAQALATLRAQIDAKVADTLMAPVRRAARSRGLQLGALLLALAVLLSLLPATSATGGARLGWFALAAFVPVLAYAWSTWRVPTLMAWKKFWAASETALVLPTTVAGEDPAKARRSLIGFSESRALDPLVWPLSVLPRADPQPLALLLLERAAHPTQVELICWVTLYAAAEGPKRVWTPGPSAQWDAAAAGASTALAAWRAASAPVAQSLEARRDAAKALRLAEQRVESAQAALANLSRTAEAWSEVVLADGVAGRLLRMLELFERRDANAPRGILLYGPPGTGKSSIATAMSASSGYTFLKTSVSELASGRDAIRDLWVKARAAGRCLIFVDECDTVLGKRDGRSGSEAATNSFLEQWDGAQDSRQVLVVGASNRRDALDPAAMQRFQEVIAIGMPDAGLRRRIFEQELARAGLRHGLRAEDMERLATDMGGQSGRAIANLVRSIAADNADGSVLTPERVRAAIESQRSARDSSRSNRGLSWEDLVLPAADMRRLQGLAAIWKEVEAARSSNFDVPRSLLLFGPPGTGKTQVARVMAAQSGLNFLAATPATLKGAYQGHTEHQMEAFFKNARDQSPSLVFIDEIDLLVPARNANKSSSFSDSVLNGLQQEMDGIGAGGDVFVLAATNNIAALDEALLSRFSQRLEVGLPDPAQRLAILERLLRGKPLSAAARDALPHLAAQTEGLAGRDLRALVDRAGQEAMMRAVQSGGGLESAEISELDLAHVPA